MQLESLKVFCDVARFRSFSQAASANHVTQSAASQIVLQLEKRLGAQLVDRSTRPLQLTALGQKYYQGCKGLIDQYLELEAAMRAEQRVLDATVHVAAIYSVGLGDMGQFIERFRQEHPSCLVHVEYLHPDRVYERMLDGTADLGLVSFPKKTRELTCVPWRDEEIVLACPPGHSFTRSRSVTAVDVAAQPYVAFTRELTIRREIDKFLREQGIAIDPAMEFDNIESIKKAVEVGAGVALLPEPTFRREVQAGTLLAVRLSGARTYRPLGILFRKHHRLSIAARAFMELLQQQPTAATRSHGPTGAASTNGRTKDGPKGRFEGKRSVLI